MKGGTDMRTALDVTYLKRFVIFFEVVHEYWDSADRVDLDGDMTRGRVLQSGRSDSVALIENGRVI